MTQGSVTGVPALRVDRLLTPQEVAEYLHVPLGTIHKWRYLRKGPRSIRVGKHLRYRTDDVVCWLEERSS